MEFNRMNFTDELKVLLLSQIDSNDVRFYLEREIDYLVTKYYPTNGLKFRPSELWTTPKEN